MDKLLAPQVDTEAFIASFAATLSQLDGVAAAGRAAAPSFYYIIFVSCGAGYWSMESIQWHADAIAKNSVYKTFTTADYQSLGMPKADDIRTLVIMSSKSGETGEMVNLARDLKRKACRTAVFTTSPQSSLAVHGDIVFSTGATSQAFQAIFMLMQAFIGGLWAENEEWPLLPELLASLSAFPKALASAAQASDDRAREHASRYKEGTPLYFVSAGAGKLTAGAHGLCVMEENLALTISLVGADHLFHSTLECVSKNTSSSFIVIITNGRGSDQMERALEFFKRFGGQEEVYDTRNLPMEGVDDAIRVLLEPYCAEAQLKRYTYHLAKKIGRDLPADLKYMGKTNY